MEEGVEEFETFTPTIGVDFKTRSLKVDDKVVKIQIWDTAGQERFRSITSAYYKGAQGMFIVYDITNPKSYDNIKIWLEEIERHADDNVFKLIVGNKCDLEHRRAIEYQTAKEFADALSIPFEETSALTRHNVDEIFRRMVVSVITGMQDENSSEQ
eukprot:GEZU01023637.1.p1 GENE.GEZU01023637.1~~GEZU01023637.1.p1  ORF type:complete len:156 (+),score=25.33 GEZU01023637.1:209-676(+)